MDVDIAGLLGYDKGFVTFYKVRMVNAMVFPANIATLRTSKSCPPHWKKPQFSDKAIRLVLFTDSDLKGRKLIFDSKGIVKEDEPSSWSKCRGKLTQGSVPAKKPCQPRYQSKRTGSEGKMLEEMMFGAVGVAYKGTSLKVHVIRNPPQLMLTKVFIPDQPARSSGSDLDDSCSFSSQSDLAAPRPISQENKASPSVAQSIPVDVPSPHRSWMRSMEVLDEDSGLASMTSSGSYQMMYPSPGSATDSYSSLNRDRRRIRGQSTSLESFTRRRSNQDLLGISQELQSGSPARPKKNKIAMGILFGTIDETNEDANKLFENFFFSHLALFESHLERLRLTIERAYNSGKYSSFVSIVIEGFECFKQEIVDLYTSPRLCEPVWLNMMCYSSYRYVLCQKFLQEFMTLVTKYDNKSTNFFVSTLVTAVLTHHLAWVPTVTPAGGTPSKTYVDKHSAKWVGTLAKSHPYNPLWAQLGDLYGAIGFPLKLSRTVVVGKKADLVKKFLYVVSYFIRCSDVLEVSDWGSLQTYMENLVFTETPLEGDKHFIPETPTPTQASSDKLPYVAQSEEVILPSRSASNRTLKGDSQIDVAKIEGDCSSSNTECSQGQRERDGLPCLKCEANRNSNNNEQYVGKSVFYVPSSVCSCNPTATSGASQTNGVGENSLDSGGTGDSDVQRGRSKSRHGLRLDIPSQKSHNGALPGSSLGECRLSMAEVVEDTKVKSIQHVHSSNLLNRVTSPVKFLGKEEASPQLPNSEIQNSQKQNHSGSEQKRVLTKAEIQALYLKEGSNSEFNEYFEDGSETKTIDEVDEKDRVVELPSTKKQRYLSGDSKLKLLTDSGSSKAPSLPDLTHLKAEGSQRERLGSLDPATFRSRKPSFNRQVSEITISSRSNLAPGRCRPVTPTELYRRRHLSSTSSFDLDFHDPRAYCKELPMPELNEDSVCTSRKEFDKNFGRSLLADYSDHYLSDFVLHGTSDKNFQEKLVQDIQMATQYSVLDEPIAEAVCVVADTDSWAVSVYSSQNMDKLPTGRKTIQSSPLVCSLVESVLHMWKLKMSPEFCMMHLEDRLQEIFFKSKMLAEYLKGTKLFDMNELSAIFGFDRSDLPLLVAIAGTHSPHLSLCVV